MPVHRALAHHRGQRTRGRIALCRCNALPPREGPPRPPRRPAPGSPGVPEAPVRGLCRGPGTPFLLYREGDPSRAAPPLLIGRACRGSPDGRPGRHMHQCPAAGHFGNSRATPGRLLPSLTRTETFSGNHPGSSHCTRGVPERGRCRGICTFLLHGNPPTVH